MRPGEVYGFTSRELIDLFERSGFALLSRQRFMLGLNCLYIFGVREPLSAAETRMETGDLARVS